MTTSGIGGVGTDYNYGSSYNSNLNYESWVNSSNEKAQELKDKYASSDSTTSTTGSTTGTSGTTGTSSSSSSSVTNKYGVATTTSAYLRNYQMALSDLESSSSALQMSKKDNVFSQYESALAAADQAGASGDATAMKSAQANVEKTFGNMVSAIGKFAEDYNTTVSFLKNNNGMTANAASDLASFERSTLTDKALQTFGLSKDKDGYLSVDKEKLTKSLEESYGFVKETVGGQYGVAERAGSKATGLLDSPVERILGMNKASSEDASKKTSSSSGSSTSQAASSKTSMPDSFTSFANFARGGAFNLTNYYAVGMLMNTVG